VSLADLAEVGKVLGIPGVMIGVWFLLERQRGERAAKVEEQKIAAEAKAEERRIDAENRRTEAMEEGFRALANMVANHAQADTKAHGVMGERLAAIETRVGITRNTPAQGVPVREINRGRSQDGNR
jgi:ribosomal protein L9